MFRVYIKRHYKMSLLFLFFYINVTFLHPRYHCNVLCTRTLMIRGASIKSVKTVSFTKGTINAYRSTLHLQSLKIQSLTSVQGTVDGQIFWVLTLSLKFAEATKKFLEHESNSFSHSQINADAVRQRVCAVRSFEHVTLLLIYRECLQQTKHTIDVKKN